MESHRYHIALDEYTKQVPPGWYPYMHNYPLKLFVEKFDAWKRQTACTESEIGVVLLGRLKGASYRIATKMRVQRYQEADPVNAPGVVALDPTSGQPIPAPTITGVDAVASLRQVHPISGAVLVKNGYELIIEALEHSYGAEEQNVKGKTLDAFFNLWRGNGALLDRRAQSTRNIACFQKVLRMYQSIAGFLS